jgi:hypothetical protein
MRVQVERQYLYLNWQLFRYTETKIKLVVDFVGESFAPYYIGSYEIVRLNENYRFGELALFDKWC